jgi:adenylate cyclase
MPDEKNYDKIHLNELLSKRIQNPECAADVDREIWEKFGQDVAILVLDMCGFSRLSRQYGVIHFLAMIHRMEQGATPAITGNGGQVVKQEADNLFAIFPISERALESALDIFRAFDAMNEVSPEDRKIYGCIGIGFGKTLVIQQRDLFGAEMNLTCKLGEDIAKKKEILLTPSAFESIPAEKYTCARTSFVIHGEEMNCFRFEKCLYPRLPSE